MNNDDPTLPGMEFPAPATNGGGPVEEGTRRAIATLRNGGWLTDAHAHIEALALSNARYYDNMPPRTKAYGHAQVTQALAKVFEMLPQPDASASAAFDELFAELEKAGDGTDA